MIDHGKHNSGYLADRIRPSARKLIGVAVLLIIGVGLLYGTQGRFGGTSLILIGLGCLMPAIAWSRETRSGLPLAAIMGLQALVIYGLPIIYQNEGLQAFYAERLFGASLEICLFGLSLTLGWWFIFHQIRPHRTRYFRSFTFLESKSPQRLVNLSQLLLLAGVAFQIANMQRWLEFLPAGTFPILRATIDALGLAGGLVSAFMVGSGTAKGFAVIRFWLLYIVYSLLIISNYTLFPACSMLMAVAFGLFLGRGKVPLFFLASIVTILAVLNIAKFDMRRAYWERDEAYADQRLDQLPQRYQEWFELGWDRLTSGADQAEIPEAQKLSRRVDSLIILMRAQSYIRDQGYTTLDGATYSIIPPLFIPRFLWPEKPRTHEGMVILNVHFGQQTREESLVTYISWGLLPEAYANFGPLVGAIFLGMALGLGLGWVEWWSREFPLASFQLFVVLTFMVNCATSFESVASVWLTSVFQMVIAMAIGLWLFTERRPIGQPAVYAGEATDSTPPAQFDSSRHDPDA